MKKYTCNIYLFLLALLCVSSCANYPAPLLATPTAKVYQTVPEPTSQSTHLSIGDGGLLSGEPCGPPCFWGIQPGKTTKEEALKILTQTGFIDYCKTFDSFQYIADREVETGGWECRIGFDIAFLKDTGIVNFIRFEPAKRLMLQDVIAKFGSPQYIMLFVEIPSDTPSSSSAKIYYPDQMFFLPLGEIKGELTYPIQPTTVIDTVIYQDAEHFDNIVENVNVATISIESYPWKGYGDYP